MEAVTPSVGAEQVAPVGVLGERLSHLRLCGPKAMQRVQQSLSRHGQLGPLTVWRSGNAGLEVLDGFKRLGAARELGWTELRIRELSGDGVEAKVAVALLNEGRGLTELEQGWLVRALYREERLPQPRIAQLLGRDKSWVYRRLALVEGLDEEVVAYVRLGLLSARAAAEISRLSRDNQRAAAERAMQGGLTAAQVGRLVGALLACPDPESRARLFSETPVGLWSQARLSRRRQRTPLEEVLTEVAQISRSSARLQSLVVEPSLWALGANASGLVSEALRGLGPVLEALCRTVERVLEENNRTATC
jgi:ParB-like chromosome segregation protein Spo0J